MKRESIAIQPHGKPAIRCENFPECMCGDDCTDRVAESPAARLILRGLMLTVAIIGAGLLLAGVWP